MGKFRPVNAKILVKKIERQNKSTILMSQEFGETLDGEVVAVGDGVLVQTGELIPLPIKVGIKVKFLKKSGVPMDGMPNHYVINYDSLLLREE